MEIAFRKFDVEEISAAPLVVPAEESGRRLSGLAGDLDRHLSGAIRDFLAEGNFEGKEGEAEVLRPCLDRTIRLIVLGSGSGRLDARKARCLAANAVQRLQALKADSGELLLPLKKSEVSPEVGTAIVEGALLGSYQFLKYQPEKLKKASRTPLSKLTVLLADEAQVRRLTAGKQRGRLMAQATAFARDLVNEPGSVATPPYLVDVAEQLARSHRPIDCRIYDKAALQEMGAGGILAVAQGSAQPAYLIHLTYRPAKSSKPKKRIALLGKGITFDAGGLSLKPSAGMEDMKIDMAGAAAVLGAFRSLAELAPSVEVHGICGVCENMPSGTATRPGDIIRTMSGRQSRS